MPIRDKDEYAEYMRRYMAERYRKRMRAAFEFLGAVCVRCGSAENLELDHVDRKDKVKSVSSLTTLSESRFFDEVKKCQVLCQKCHTDKTLSELGLRRADHGSFTMYRHHGCRCALCRRAAAEQRRRWREKQQGLKL